MSPRSTAPPPPDPERGGRTGPIGPLGPSGPADPAGSITPPPGWLGPPAPGAASGPPSRGTGAVVAATLMGAATVLVTAGLALSGWFVDELLLLYGATTGWWLWPVLSLGNAALIGVPALLLVLITRASRWVTPTRQAVGAVATSWLAAAGALAGLGSLRAVPPQAPEWYLALLAAAAALLAALLTRLRRRPARPDPPSSATAGDPSGAVPPGAETWPEAARSGAARSRPARSGAVPFAIAAGLVVLLPWLWLGAFGGVLETVLGAVAAAAVGWLAAALLGPVFWRHFPTSRPRLVLFGGSAAGVTLLLLAAGLGGSGAHLAMLLVLPPLGLVAAALVRAARPLPHRVARYAPGDPPTGDAPPVPTRWPVAVLIGLAVAGPLTLVDPEEISLLLAGDRDIPFWAALAAGCSLGLGLLLALAYSLRPGRGPRWLVAVSVAVVAALTATIGYATVGQPGFHGERLFVILADQADLTGLPTGTGEAARTARATEVYRRLVAHAEASQADLRAELARRGLEYTPYYLVNAVEVAAGPVVRQRLTARPDVDRVLVAQQPRPLPAPAPAATGTRGLAPADPEWNIALLRADAVWREFGVTGAGVVVGSSDSGVDAAHPTLAAGFRGGDDSWLDPWRHTTRPTDRAGHGTHTLGSAVGRGGIGVAPDAQWVGCVNLLRNLGNPARYLDCLQFMLAPYPTGGDPWRDGRPARAPHVLTNSWGCPPIEGCDAETLRPATAALTAAGIYVVVAAGNTGPFCGSIQDPPAPHPDVLTVGAVDRHGRVAAFSSRGPAPGADKPDLVAPGADVVSAMPGGGYAALAGTSMAAPHVAGVVALMWSANPELIGDLATTTRLLRSTAQPVPMERGDCGGPAAHVGAGVVNAYAAVAAARDARGLAR